MQEFLVARELAGRFGRGYAIRGRNRVRRKVQISNRYRSVLDTRPGGDVRRGGRGIAGEHVVADVRTAGLNAPHRYRLAVSDVGVREARSAAERHAIAAYNSVA